MIGVISDTHGLLRPEALAALRGASHILHAGDVGDIAILDAVRQIAPVTAIRGNIDTNGPTAQLPATEAVELDGHLIYMLHSLADLDLNARRDFPTSTQVAPRVRAAPLGLEHIGAERFDLFKQLNIREDYCLS